MIDLALPRVVFYLVTIFGVLLVFLVPPFQAPDEDTHLFRAVTILEGNLLPKENQGVWGHYLPASLVEYAASHRYLIGNLDQKYSYARWYIDSHQKMEREPRVFRTFSTQSSSPFLYIPQVSGILIGKILYSVSPLRNLGFNWPAALYFSRLGNLFVFAFVLAFVLKILPRYHAIVSFLALTPMSIHLASSSGYDVTTIVTCAFFFALTAVIVNSRRTPNAKEKIYYAIVAFLLTQAKIVYMPLLLLLLVFWRRMESKEHIKFSIYIVASSVTGILLTLFVFGLPKDPDLAKASHEQLVYLVTNLGAIPELIYGTLIHFSDYYTISFLGNLGWLDTNFSLPVIVGLWGILLCAFIHDALGGPSPFGLTGNVIMILGSLFSVILIMLVLYVIWTSVQQNGIGASLVDGVQGRYFIPIFPFFIAAFAATPIFIKDRLSILQPRLLEFQVLGNVVVLILTVCVVILRYWVK